MDVTNESTLEATRRLGGDIAALVFASARNPGGGFLLPAVLDRQKGTPALRALERVASRHLD